MKSLSMLLILAALACMVAACSVTMGGPNGASGPVTFGASDASAKMEEAVKACQEHRSADAIKLVAEACTLISQDKLEPYIDPKMDAMLNRITAANRISRSAKFVAETLWSENQRPAAGQVFTDLTNAAINGSLKAKGVASQVLEVEADFWKSKGALEKADAAYSRLMALDKQQDWNNEYHLVLYQMNLAAVRLGQNDRAGAVAAYQEALAHSKNWPDMQKACNLALDNLKKP